MAEPILPQNFESASDLPGKPKKLGRPEYYAWHAMIGRCSKENHPAYKDYGARGISVCGRWLNFSTFYSDMGPRPSAKHTLERGDNNGNYCADNCCWADHKTQANNRRSSRYLTFAGESRTISEWAGLTGVNVQTIFARLRVGKTPEECLRLERLPRKSSTPIRDHDRK